MFFSFKLYVGQLLSQAVAPVFVPAVAAGGTKLFFFNANNQLYSIGTEYPLLYFSYLLFLFGSFLST